MAALGDKGTNAYFPQLAHVWVKLFYK